LKSGISISSHRRKVLLLRDGLKEYRCESCGQTEWLGQPIPLELHHIDGNRNNNQLSNLQLLCANCHALTPNNSGRGIKRK
jgi:5-methylcytosine-specific restriction endonuclease McrA